MTTRRPPAPPRRQSFTTRGAPQIGSRPSRGATPPPPAVVGPPPPPAVVGPPPVPTAFSSSNSLPKVQPAPQAPTNLPKALTQPELPLHNEQPTQRKKTKVAAISSSPWFPFIEVSMFLLLQ